MSQTQPEDPLEALLDQVEAADAPESGEVRLGDDPGVVVPRDKMVLVGTVGDIPRSLSHFHEPKGDSLSPACGCSINNPVLMPAELAKKIDSTPCGRWGCFDGSEDGDAG